MTYSSIDFLSELSVRCKHTSINSTRVDYRYHTSTCIAELRYLLGQIKHHTAPLTRFFASELDQDPRVITVEKTSARLGRVITQFASVEMF